LSSDDVTYAYLLGQRLREERKRLLSSQRELADVCNITREAIGRYERGENIPGGDVLAKMAEAGADVLYILTGNRTPLPGLTHEESALLDNYRHSPPDGRKSIENIGHAFAQQPESKKTRRA